MKAHQKKIRADIGKLSALNAQRLNAQNKNKAVKDKEKAKRMKGQSSQHSWKSETFMLLRQQFD